MTLLIKRMNQAGGQAQVSIGMHAHPKSMHNFDHHAQLLSFRSFFRNHDGPIRLMSYFDAMYVICYYMTFYAI